MDLQDYKDKYPEQESRLTRLETEAKLATMLLDLKDHAGIKILLDELEQMVNNINVQLLRPGRLESEEREKLLTDKERCQWFLDILPNAEATIKKIEDYLQKL